MIRVEDLHKSFNGPEVLRGVSLQVERGEVLALIGMSGYGKSVLLKHIAGLMKPDRGRVLVAGLDMARTTGKELERLRSRFGFLFQGGALFDSLTVFENVAFPLRERGASSSEEIRRTVLSKIEEVGLAGSEHKYPAELSGGMVKRAALARALVKDPEIMLFDEPTTGLDPIIACAILTLIRKCHRNLGFTGIIVTHQIPRIFDIVQKVALLHEGTILAVGTPEEIVSSENPIVKEFIHGSVKEPIG
ncbi:MAG: ABC transporter ATP-binding protein [Deltaproteobacteria bacterium]|nr:ABC transporter ATP-binding protein [Deltaproteobacteria bacterium]MBW2120438.1 ABC transporter ATP-binding protein [Deltaproteobacteria bacterium]